MIPSDSVFVLAHLAHSVLCCEEVREAWRRKQGGGVRGLDWSANKQTPLSGSSWR